MNNIIFDFLISVAVVYANVVADVRFFRSIFFGCARGAWHDVSCAVITAHKRYTIFFFFRGTSLEALKRS